MVPDKIECDLDDQHGPTARARSLGFVSRRTESPGRAITGRLRIGDDWNAITIIALSQSNPLKAVAEFVENSIDARARHITITRGKERGEHYLRIVDDGEGIPCDESGAPNFKYVATHICDSVKRRLKEGGVRGLQGEFGIGLLSFWTIGEEMLLTSSGTDGRIYQMSMRKGEPGYRVNQKRALLASPGMELTIKPLLPGIRYLSGEKIQWYLASELRDRIRQSGAHVSVIDRQARKEYAVEPRQFSGRLLHQLSPVMTPLGEVYLEIYLSESESGNHVGLYRHGTRVLDAIEQLDPFLSGPWGSGYLQGIVDAPFLNLTPGTRTGVIRDEAFEAFCVGMAPLGDTLRDVIEAQQRAEEERASEHMLRAIQRAFREALLALPVEEYDWFDIHLRRERAGAPPGTDNGIAPGVEAPGFEEPVDDRQKQFFEFAGPMHSVRISPASSVVAVAEQKSLRAIARDRARHAVEHPLGFSWEVIEGGGHLENHLGEVVTFHAPDDPGLVRLRVVATQGEIECVGEAAITVTDSLLPEDRGSPELKRGLPNYTFQRAPAELWRSRYDTEQNVIVINNGHRDFVYASRNKSLKLRYISRLFAKEMVYRNFPGQSAEQLLERMIELSLYTEEHLRL